jgi:DNA-binding PadR family transcriptional regulator
MSLRHSLLGLLSEEPGSGWDLMRKFELSLENIWPATQSQVYTELGKLAEAGLIAVTATGPRGRKEYAITDEGRAELRRWLLEPRRPRRQFDDLLLRVTFLNAVEPNQAREFLTKTRDAVLEREKELEKLKETVNWGDDALSVYGRMTLEYGLRYTRMHAEWADWAIARLPEE